MQHTMITLLADLRRILEGSPDDYYDTVVTSTVMKVSSEPFVMCSFIEPDGETLSFPMEWTGGAWYRLPESNHPFYKFNEWMKTKLVPAINPTRGDGCLYQAGWVVSMSDGTSLVTTNITYEEKSYVHS